MSVYGGECAICHDPIKAGDNNTTVLPCGHVFHTVETNDCMGFMKWYTQNQTCILCRKPVTPKKPVKTDAEISLVMLRSLFIQAIVDNLYGIREKYLYENYWAIRAYNEGRGWNKIAAEVWSYHADYSFIKEVTEIFSNEGVI